MSDIGKFFKRIGKQVKKHAPIIGDLLIPGGSGAGKVFDIVKTLIGADGADDAERILANDPQAFLKLKEYEQRHKEELEKLQLEETKAFLADVQSARDREKTIVQATGRIDWFIYILAGVLFFGFFGLIVTLIFVKLPVDSTGVIFMLFGALVSGFTSVVNYFFGSSRSSQEKTNLLAQNNRKD